MKDNKIVVLQSLFWKFAERMGSQFVTFVVSILLARLISPDDYGAIALIMVFITISNVLVTNGFSTALIQKKMQILLTFHLCFILISDLAS